MKKVLLMTVVFSAIAIAAISQPRQQLDPEQRVKNLMLKVNEEMSLSEEKKTQIEFIYKTFYQESAELRESGSFDREKMIQRREKLSEQLLEVLTQDERDKLIEIERSQWQQRRSQ